MSKGKQSIAKGYVGIEYVMAALGGRGYSTIRKMIKESEGSKGCPQRLPEPSQDGKRIVWKQSEIDLWIKNGKHLIR